jgi:glycosyltransferase involved in cell wall biosynthesis
VRILLDYRPALRERTGVGQYVHELALALQSQLSPADTLTLFSSSWKDRLQRPAGIAGVDARVPVSVLNYAWHRLEWPPVERFAGPIDIAHAAHPLLLPSSRAARVITVHDLDFLDHPERTRAEIRRDYATLAPDHARRADLVVAVSQHTASLVASRLAVPAERLVVCRPGAGDVVPRPEPPGAGPILFVGTIEPRKNLPVLFEAYERVLRRRPDAPDLILAGKTVEQSGAILQYLASRTPLTGHVQQRGYVSDEERQQLYRDASMLVLPSLEEGFGFTALEAMQIGVPVVASNRGALPEVVGSAGLLVDPKDPEGFALAIESLLADSGLRHRQADAGRARAREFSWTTSAAGLLEAYRDLLARRGARRR